MKMTQKRIQLASAIGLFTAMAVSANAQLAHYYQFSTGSANDQVGTANGTLQGGATITGGALVTAGGNGTVSGAWGGTGPMMTLNSSVVSGITGGFTIEDWFTCSTGWPKFDSLYAFSDGTQNNFLMGNPVQGYSPWPSGVNVDGAGGVSILYGTPAGRGIYLDTSGSHETVLTYDGSMFSYYVDGVLANFSGYAATLSDPGFNLSTLTDVALNGGSPFGDPALTGSTYSFGIFNGALTASQVSSLYGLGSDASVPLITSTVPEPGTMALAALGGAGLCLWRRRQVK